MRNNSGYYVGAALVVIVVIGFGLVSNMPRLRSDHPPAALSRFQVPAPGLSENASVRSVDKVEAQRGGYPPRALGLAVQRKPPSDSWLLDADSDTERFRRIEVALRGLDIQMVEIGARFTVMHDAIERGNLPLAQLEAQKTIESARIAMLKRPGFGSDEGLKYMGAAQWTALMGALQAGDAAKSRAAFLDVRQSCLSCHAARGMSYLNGSALFESTAQFAAGPGTATAAESRDARRQTEGSAQ
jgi:mono/diheme cytochrome c family protein